MLKVGITGGIGSGKTTVCEIFSSFGVPIFNSDKSSRDAEKVDGMNEKIVEIVGDSIIENGVINRHILRKIIFNDKEKLDAVSGLFKDYVLNDLNNFYNDNLDKKYVLVESAILYETGFYKEFDVIISVTASEETRLKRAMNRDGVSEDEIKDKIKNQLSESYKAQLSDFVIVNEDEETMTISYDKLLVQVKQLNGIFNNF